MAAHMPHCTSLFLLWCSCCSCDRCMYVWPTISSTICSIALVFATLPHTHSLTWYLFPSLAIALCVKSMFVDVRASRAADTTREPATSLSKSRILTNKAWEIEAYWFRPLLWHLFCCCRHPPKSTFKLCLSSCAWTVDQAQVCHWKAIWPALHLLWLVFLHYPLCWERRGFFSPWTWISSHLASTYDHRAWLLCL